MGDRDSPSNSSLLSGTQDARRVASAARVVRAAPPPEQWTLVRELNMEKRDPCEVRNEYKPLRACGHRYNASLCDVYRS